MRRVISVAVLVALAALCAAAIPGHAANEILLRRSAGTVGYKHDLGAPFITVTGVQAVADDAYAITQASSVGVVVFPDSSLVTLGASTTIRVGAFRLAQNGNGSTIQIPSGGGELRLEIRHPQGQRSNYQFSTSIMNLAVRGTIALLADAPTGDTLTCLDCGANDVVVTAGGRDYALLSGQTMHVTPDGKVTIDPTSDAVLQSFGQVGLSTAGGAPTGSFGATSAGSNNAILPVAAGAIAIGALAAASHGGGSAPIITPPPSPSPTVAPTATPAPAYGPVVLTPSFVALTVGQSKTVTASQSGNTTNTFTVGAPVVCPGTGNGTVVQTAPGTFQVTSTATSSGRTCTVQVNGLGGQFTTLGMTL